MRPLLLSALLLAAASPALAQTTPDAHDQPSADRGHDNRGGDNRGHDNHGGDNRGGDSRGGGDHRGDRGGDQQYRGDNRGDDQHRGADHNDRGGDRGQFRGDDRGAYRGDDRGYHGDDRGFQGGDRHGGDRGYHDDRRSYGDGDQFARFHGGAFFYPRGYGYRSYGIGAFLPRAFFGDRYFIADPYAYRLPPAFAGTRWIRVGPDALLIRAYDGRVVRVIRGLFY